MTNEEKFFAWLDGELGAIEAAEVEARVAADPALAALAKQHRAFGSSLKASFAPVVDAPVPERLRDAARPTAQVIDLREAKARRWPAVPQWAAMAATLAIGIVVGTMVRPDNGVSPIELQEGRMVAAASLVRALDTQLASAQAAGPVRVGMTFRDGGGAICRSFTDAGSSGLACREGSDWRVRGLFTAPEGQQSDYRMAAGTDPNLAALIDSSIDGEPFDAAQEKAAQARGWR